MIQPCLIYLHVISLIAHLWGQLLELRVKDFPLHTDRQTNRQSCYLETQTRDRNTDTDADRWTETKIQTQTERDRETDFPLHTHTCADTIVHRDTATDRETTRHGNSHRYRERDRQTHRETQPDAHLPTAGAQLLVVVTPPPLRLGYSRFLQGRRHTVVVFRSANSSCV